VDGARVRAQALERIARAAGGAPLAAQVRALAAADARVSTAEDVRELYGRQERAAVLIAAHLDGTIGG
jgi:hypothetical protein